jgi:GWxTD domain-containing protein
MRYLFITLFLILFLLSCRSSKSLTAVAGMPNYDHDGLPEFYVVSEPVLRGDERFVELHLEFKPEGFVFVTEQGEQAATALLYCDFTDRLLEDSLKSEHYKILLKKSDFSPFSNSLQMVYSIPAPANPTRISITIEDGFTRKARTIEQQIGFAVKSDSQFLLSDVVMKTKMQRSREGWVANAKYHIPSNSDSIRFAYSVHVKDESIKVSAKTRLVRFTADSTINRPIFAQDLSASTLTYIGVDLYRNTVLNVQSRQVPVTEEPIIINQTIPLLTYGVYRFIIDLVDPSGKVLATSMRDFSITSAFFPYVKDAHALAEPLVYLMERKQHKSLMEIEHTDSLLSAIESFWINSTGNASIALQTMKVFYTRVEEANVKFSSFKEGWKTDMGYVYILFGPPNYVDVVFNNTVWKYGFDHSIPHRVFEFNRVRIKGPFYPFDHYLIKRQNYYYNAVNRRIGDWKNGSAIYNPLF